MFDTANFSALKAALRGHLIEAMDPAYEEARALYNGMIDKRPLAIARCTDIADVIAVVVRHQEVIQPGQAGLLDRVEHAVEIAVAVTRMSRVDQHRLA